MNTKILKKLSANVKLEKVSKKYCVFQKKDDEWEEIYSTTRFPQALLRKHNAWHNIIYRLGYTARLMNRRKDRRRKNKNNVF